MSFDEFADQVEAHVRASEGWTDIELADFTVLALGFGSRHIKVALLSKKRHARC